MTTTNYAKLNCPVAKSLSILGDQWTILIVRDALSGLSRFSEYRDSLGISRNLLSRRLQHLCDEGILERQPIPGSKRYAYLPTAKCRDLQSIVLTMAAWGNKWCEEEGLTKVECRDRQSGNLVKIGFIDTKTKQAVSQKDLTIVRRQAR